MGLETDHGLPGRLGCCRHDSSLKLMPGSYGIKPFVISMITDTAGT
ncbi:hypothetical protein KR100_15360 [Synechococcus sp. KORDI-100]|nr:hypothetical protein KR100_15360 [Synechococcus sp. KORDI-100]